MTIDEKLNYVHPIYSQFPEICAIEASPPALIAANIPMSITIDPRKPQEVDSLDI
uniref:Uncharacterized protein n=1 Tax=Arion vulgaris TaxID=1028688 RepID=A0A0B6ZDY0_9EUPU